MFLSFSAALPLSTSRVLGTALGTLLNCLPTRERYYSNRNLELCLPDLSKSQRKALVRSSLVETGKSLMELGALWRWPEEKLMPLIQKIEGVEHVEAARQHKKGIIFVLAHLGSWELAGLYISTLNQTTVIYNPPKLPHAEKVICEARSRFDAQLVPTNRQGVKALLKALSNDEQVIILPDQDPGSGAGVFAPFFGIQTNTTTLVSKLAARAKAPVVHCYAERLEGAEGYQIYFRAADEDSASLDLPTSAKALNADLESCIREIPDQYQWSYKRFKYRPDDEPRIY